MSKHSLQLTAAGLLLAALLALPSCSGGGSNSQLQRQLDSLTALTSRQQTDIVSMESFVTALAEGLDTIAYQEGLLFHSSQGPEGTMPDRNQLQRNLDSFASTLAEQRERIQLMADSLRSQGVAVEKLQRLVDYLNSQIDEKDRMISQLRQELSQKNTDIAQLRNRMATMSRDNTKLAEQMKASQQQAQELAAQQSTGYIVMGSAKSLKEHGVTQGGGLLKKQKVNYEQLPKELFTKVDIRTFGGLEIPSSKAKLVSEHPARSYEIVKTGKDASELHILSPEAFWTATRYVVIQTK